MKTYLERQKDWVKENNLKEGDKVKVLRSCENGKDGWNNSWVKEMDCFIGKEFKVDYIYEDEDFGISLENEVFYEQYDFPYFVLEKVKEVKPDSRERMIGKEYNFLGSSVKVLAIYKEFAWVERLSNEIFSTARIGELKEIKKDFVVGDRVARKANPIHKGTIKCIVREYAFIDWDDGDISMNKIDNLQAAE